jgi:predicted transcriptional regulator
MNIQAEKLLLIDKIINLTNKKKVLIIKDFIEEKVDIEPWDELSKEEKASIKRGLKDIKDGKTIPFEVVKKKWEKRLKRKL